MSEPWTVDGESEVPEPKGPGENNDAKAREAARFPANSLQKPGGFAGLIFAGGKALPGGRRVPAIHVLLDT